MNWKVFLSWFIIGLAIVGIIDTAYLTYQHYQNVIPPCTVSAFADCGRVLHSQYSVILGIPLALLGLFHYICVFVFAILSVFGKNKFWRKVLFFFTAWSLLVSLFLVYLQLFVIGAICQYCMVSALASVLLYVLARMLFKKEYRELFYMKRAGIIVFGVRPIQNVLGYKHQEHRHKKKGTIPHIENKYLRSLIHYVPRHKLEEFFHEVHSQKS